MIPLLDFVKVCDCLFTCLCRKGFLVWWVPKALAAYTCSRNWSVKGPHSSSSSCQLFPQWQILCYMFERWLHFGISSLAVYLWAVLVIKMFCSTLTLFSSGMQVIRQESSTILIWRSTVGRILSTASLMSLILYCLCLAFTSGTIQIPAKSPCLILK